MKKVVLVGVVAMLTMSFAFAPAFAQSSGSFAGDFMKTQGFQIIDTITCLNTDSTCPSKHAFLAATIKMPAAKGKALLIAGSLQTFLSTDTSVIGTGTKQTSTAKGSVVVTPEVTLNGQTVDVFPDKVVFDERLQQLTANLSPCITTATGVTCTDAEMIDLLLSTTSAHSFNFIAQNAGSGVYTVKLHVNVTTEATSTSVKANSAVSVGVGVGSLAVQLVQVQTPFSSLCFDLVNGTSCP